MKMPEVSNNCHKKKAPLLLLLLLSCAFSFAQKNIKNLTPIDTTPVTTKISAEKKIDATKEIKKDTAAKKHSPKIAATRSAIFPGLGQIYNKKYWKLPIVYGAMGVSTYIFLDNIKTYREYRFAYNARYKASLPAPRTDSTDYYKLDNIYKIIQPESIRAARNKFRQYVDYSVLFFILMWGLNVVDATVDAHLQSFDVSPNLSLSIEPGRSQMAGTNGISLVLHIGKK
jgi:Family of unknown function (DUF5683)